MPVPLPAPFGILLEIPKAFTSLLLELTGFAPWSSLASAPPITSTETALLLLVPYLPPPLTVNTIDTKRKRCVVMSLPQADLGEGQPQS